MNDEYYMNIALAEAKKAYKKNDVPVGAIVVLNNKIIGRGYNKKAKSHDVTSHAEIIALRKACKKLHDWRLEKAILYVTMSPCPMCASAIVQSRLEKIVIGASNPDLNQKEIIDLLFKAKKVQTGVLEKECVTLLQTFFQTQRKKGQIK